MKCAKQFLVIFVSIAMMMVMTIFLLSGFSYSYAYADTPSTSIAAPDASTRVLSGAIYENVDLPAEVTSVVLDGVNMNNNARIRINADHATVTLANGTNNKIASLEGMGSLEFQGSGNLEGTSIFAVDGIAFNGTGNYAFPNGGIFNFSGEMAFNSGNFNISTGTSEMGYAVASGSGNISLNGANMDLHGRVSALHSSGTLVLAGGSLKATSVEDPAVLAGYKISNGITVSPSMILDNNLKPGDLSVEGGSVVTALVNQEGKGVTGVSAHGEAVAAGSVTAQETKAVPYNSDYVNSLFGGNQNGTFPTIMAVIAVVLCIAAVASAALLATRRKHARKAEASGSGSAGTAGSKSKKAFKSATSKTICIVLAFALVLSCGFAKIPSAFALQAVPATPSSAGTASSQAGATQTATQAASTPNSNVITGTVHDDGASWEYYYTDDYFARPASQYNASLSTTSLSMARSAFGVIDHDDYSCAYRNIEAFMMNNGFKAITPNQYMTTMPTAETVGVTVGSKAITDENGQKCTLVAVAVRGGNYEGEWGSNVKMGATGESEGFAHARDLVIEHLSKYLADHAGEFNGRLKIWIAGFSRAAATSNLTGNFLDCAVQGTGQNTQLMQTARSALSKYNISTNDIYCYTFETPKGGHDTSIYKANDTSNLFCMINPVDPVPYVAPGAFGFKHYGKDVDITSVDFSKVLANANNIAGGTMPYAYAQELSGETPFAPYKYTGVAGPLAVVMKNGINSLMNSVLKLPNTSKPLTEGAFEAYRTNFKDAKFTSRADYNEKLFDLVCNAGANRENYANNLQPFVSTITEKIMGGTNVDKANFMKSLLDGVKDNVNYYEMAMLTVEVIRPKIAADLVVAGFLASHEAIPDKTGIIPTVVGAVTTAVTSTLGTSVWSAWRAKIWAQDGFISGEHSLQERLEKALKGGLKNAHDKGSLTDDQYNSSNKCAGSMTIFLINFLKNDERCDFQFTLTAVKYGAYLFNPHYPVVSAEYLMANDDNYNTSHNFTITGWNTQLAKDAKAKVYSVDENGAKTQIAAVENGTLTGVNGGNAPDSLSLKTVRNGYVIQSAYDKANNASNAGVSVEVTSSASISVDYANHGNGQKGFASSTQYFEQTEIPMGAGDTVTMTAKNASPNAEFKKTLTPQFVYGTIDGKTGAITESKPGTSVYVNSVLAPLDERGAVVTPVNASGICSFTTDNAIGGDLTAYRVYKAKRAADGSIQVDASTGKPNMTRLATHRVTYPFDSNPYPGVFIHSNQRYSLPPTVNWNESFDITSTSPIYFVESANSESPLTVQAKGITHYANGKTQEMSNGTFTLQNLTTGEKYYETPLKAKPGDMIYAKLGNYSDWDVFLRWSIDAGGLTPELKEGSPLSGGVKFVMPSHDVDLTAMFFKKENQHDTLAVFNGAWAYNCTSAAGAAGGAKLMNPADSSWTEKFGEVKSDQASYLASGAHVLKKEQGEQTGKYLFIQAPKTIDMATGEDYAFDHWEARYLDTGKPVTDAIARRLNLVHTADGGYASATFTSDGEDGYGSPHGSTSPVLCIPNSMMKESIVFEPVFASKQYSYCFTLTNGKRVVGTAKPGEVVRVEDVGTAERSFKLWDVSCNMATYTPNPDGTLSLSSATRKMSIADADCKFLTFVMPHGDVWGSTVYSAKKYSLNTMRAVKAYDGSMLGVNDVTTEGARYEYEAGETVIMRVKTEAGKVFSGWNCNSKDVTIAEVKGADGKVDHYEFVMPAHSVTCIPVFKDGASSS